MRTIDHKGTTVKYDEKMLNRWDIQRALAKMDASSFDALDRILCGKADEVAESLGGTMEDVADLMEHINRDYAELSESAKN